MSELLRKQFEAAIKQQGYAALTRRTDNGCYKYAPTEHAWQGYQAALKPRQLTDSECRQLHDALKGRSGADIPYTIRQWFAGLSA